MTHRVSTQQVFYQIVLSSIGREPALIATEREAMSGYIRESGWATPGILQLEIEFVSSVRKRIGSAPGKAWHLLGGESPCRARPNQPPVSSVAYATEVVE